MSTFTLIHRHTISPRCGPAFCTFLSLLSLGLMMVLSRLTLKLHHRNWLEIIQTLDDYCHRHHHHSPSDEWQATTAQLWIHYFTHVTLKPTNLEAFFSPKAKKKKKENEETEVLGTFPRQHKANTFELKCKPTSKSTLTHKHFLHCCQVNSFDEGLPVIKFQRCHAHGASSLTTWIHPYSFE